MQAKICPEPVDNSGHERLTLEMVVGDRKSRSVAHVASSDYLISRLCFDILRICTFHDRAFDPDLPDILVLFA